MIEYIPQAALLMSGIAIGAIGNRIWCRVTVAAARIAAFDSAMKLNLKLKDAQRHNRSIEQQRAVAVQRELWYAAELRQRSDAQFPVYEEFAEVEERTECAA